MHNGYLIYIMYAYDRITFMFSSGPPSIKSLQSTTYVVQGQSVQLNCTFGGLPVPNITWTTPNGSIIISQSHFMVQSTNTSTSLTISPLGPGDSGTYNCTASNFIGMSSASIQLIVQSKNIIVMKKCTCISFVNEVADV